VFPPRRRVKELESPNRIFTGEIYTMMGSSRHPTVLNFTTDNTEELRPPPMEGVQQGARTTYRFVDGNIVTFSHSAIVVPGDSGV